MILDRPEYISLDAMMDEFSGRNWRRLGDVCRVVLKESIVNGALAGNLTPDQAYRLINDNGLREV